VHLYSGAKTWVVSWTVRIRNKYLKFGHQLCSFCVIIHIIVDNVCNQVVTQLSELFTNDCREEISADAKILDPKAGIVGGDNTQYSLHITCENLSTQRPICPVHQQHEVHP